MEGRVDADVEFNPTKEHMQDPYVLQLIQGLSGQQDIIEEFEVEAGLAKERYDAVWEQAEKYEELANANKRKAGEMQLAAGRYQYMHEHAQKCINKIDDLFEYAYLGYELPVLQERVRTFLANYTEAVVKVATAIQAPDSIIVTAAERIADPKLVDVDLKEL